MTQDTDPVADGLRRALEAAELANDAAEDVSRLGAAHQAFADRMIAAQKRTTNIAGGALAGAAVALGLASLVYFRSVADLRETSAVQAEVSALIVEQVLAMKASNEMAAGRATALEDKLDGVAKQMADGMAMAQAMAQAAPAPELETGLADTLAGQLKASEDSILAALAEVDLRMPNGTAVTDALARIEAGLLRATAAPAVPQAEAKASPAAKPAQKPATKAKPRVEAAPEPNPFAYP